MKKISSALCIIILSICFFAAQTSIAQQPDNTSRVPAPDNTTRKPTQTVPSLQNPLKAKSVEQVLLLAVDLAIFVGTIIAVLVFIWIGFKFVMAQGDPGKLKDARKWFLNAVIGTAILIGSKVIVEVVKETFISAGIVDKSLWEKNL